MLPSLDSHTFIFTLQLSHTEEGVERIKRGNRHRRKDAAKTSETFTMIDGDRQRWPGTERHKRETEKHKEECLLKHMY